MAGLRVVDALVDGRRKGAADGERVRGTLFELGAYVGEVPVRRAGGERVDLDEGQRAYFGQPVGVRMPDGRIRNLVGTVRIRLEEGRKESLQTFYLVLHGRAGRTTAA
ncbi:MULTISPECIES: hypothetical protein [unclassified Streptomyces]|uniref:hypothetical protein n=1 Tax=unclassified Streptomyces TaxID=2593676 RepID=UPI000A8CFFF6|nr:MULTISPECIES: hypothetical protein [unclassified Streptomyces]